MHISYRFVNEGYAFSCRYVMHWSGFSLFELVVFDGNLWVYYVKTGHAAHAVVGFGGISLTDK